MNYANHEKRAAYKKAYYEANLEQIQAYHRAYYKAHCEEIKGNVRANREANPDRRRPGDQRYRETHPDKMRIYRKANPVASRLRDAKGYRREQAKQSFSAGRAVRNRLPWAAWEDAEIMCDDLSRLEIALRLGRTMVAISNRSRRLRQQAA